MIKNNKGKVIVSSVLILLPLLAGLLLWNRLPAEIPIHWNAAGEIDGYGSRLLAVCGIPLFAFAMHWLCLLATAIDPKNKAQTHKAIGMVLWICPAISIAVGTMMYAAAFGITFDITVIMPILMGVMVFLLGNYLPKCKQNYTIGIKLPWTMDSEDNWTRTHRLAGRVWVAGGLLTVVSVFLPLTPRLIALGVIFILLILVPTVYSYRLYKKG